MMALPRINVVQLTLTNRCQCNCLHCGVAGLRATMKEELPLERIEAIFQDLSLAGVQVVDLFGGEPTLRRDLFEIIGLGKSRGFIMSLETNGYVIDESYMAGLVEAGLDQIYLSLDDYRAEVHDALRRKEGCFDRAVRALELGARAGITMHVSTVPPNREAFINGGINRFMDFVLRRGASQVRMLLPRFAGKSIQSEGGPLYAGEEEDLFSHLAPEYREYIYVHTPGTPPGETNICTAKHVFCHIMSNGWITPCPYFPLVFGDALREPVVDVFERIQSHPLVRLGGDTCPMRNGDYIEGHLRKAGLFEAPFLPITMENMIDLGAPCEGACPDCHYGGALRERSGAEIISEIEALSPHYTRVAFFGGDALCRGDLPEILARVPPSMQVVLWTACGDSLASDIGKRLDMLKGVPLEAIRMRLVLPPDLQRVDSASDREAALERALLKATALSSRGIPVHCFVEAGLMNRIHGHLARMLYRTGVERLYVFTEQAGDALPNYVACFGKKVGTARLLWARREGGDENERAC